jgi:hypothetical protein
MRRQGLDQLGAAGLDIDIDAQRVTCPYARTRCRRGKGTAQKNRGADEEES